MSAERAPTTPVYVRLIERVADGGVRTSLLERAGQIIADAPDDPPATGSPAEAAALGRLLQLQVELLRELGDDALGLTTDTLGNELDRLVRAELEGGEIIARLVPWKINC